MTYVVVDLLESIVRECGHCIGRVSVSHADGVVDGLQHTSQAIHIYLRRHWLKVGRDRKITSTRSRHGTFIRTTANECHSNCVRSCGFSI